MAGFYGMPLLDFLSFSLLLQVGSLQHSGHGDARYRNTVDGLRIIVRNQGWRQLFAGVSINYIRVINSHLTHAFFLIGLTMVAFSSCLLFVGRLYLQQQLVSPHMT